jgi:hypothetical protein
MLQTASAIFPNTIAAFEGMELELELEPPMALSWSYPAETDTPRVCSLDPVAS